MGNGWLEAPFSFLLWIENLEYCTDSTPWGLTGQRPQMRGIRIGQAQRGFPTAHGCGGLSSYKGPAEVLQVELEIWPVPLVDSYQSPWRASVLLIYTKPQSCSEPWLKTNLNVGVVHLYTKGAYMCIRVCVYMGTHWVCVKALVKFRPTVAMW